MKFLLILLFPILSFANFIPVDKVGDCTYATYHMTLQACDGQCIEVPMDYNCQYHEILDNTIIENEANKAAYLEVKLQKDLLENPVRQAMMNQDCGKKIVALMSVRNKSRNVSNQNKKLLLQTYSSIISMLNAGSLDLVKEEMLLVEPDGSLITNEDKDALIAKINECL